MSVTFTDEQKRLVNSYYPGLGTIPPSVGSGGLLTVIADAVDAAIAAGPTADAAAALAAANEADDTADTAQAAAVAAQADIDGHQDGGTSKHDATEVDYERADGSKKNIQAGSDAVEAALSDLDDATGLLSGLTTTDKATVVAAINEVDANADTANARIVNRVDPMGVFGTWGKDVDGAETNGGGLVGVTAALTQVGAGQAKCDNGGVIGNLSAGPLAGDTSNYQLFPDVPIDNDAFYVGRVVPFCELAFDIGTAQVSTGACITPEYWNGAAWATLTNLVDATSAAAVDGTRPFEQDGAMTFFPPADWAQCSIDAITVYWVRFRVSTQANMGVALGTMNAKQPEVVTPGDGYLARLTGTIETIRLNDGGATLHTTADVKFFLMDYTTGVTSGLLTFAQDQRTDYWTGLAMAVADGDELGVVCVQEDGTNEPANVLLELGYVVT